VPDYTMSSDWATAACGGLAHDPVTKAKSGNLVLSSAPTATYDVFKFRRFRLNLIRFLKLPLDVSEKDLRNAIMQCSVNVLANYMGRAQCAVADSGGVIEVPVRQTPPSIERAVAI
jgi:hypothetical protein